MPLHSICFSNNIQGQFMGTSVTLFLKPNSDQRNCKPLFSCSRLIARLSKVSTIFSVHWRATPREISARLYSVLYTVQHCK